MSDAILLGLGISFLLFGYPMLRKVTFDAKARAWGMYLSIGYAMVSWWPHLGMHATNGLDLQGLLYIDYIFHLPLEIAGVVLAYCAFASFRGWMRRPPLHKQQELGGEDRLAGNPKQ